MVDKFLEQVLRRSPCFVPISSLKEHFVARDTDFEEIEEVAKLALEYFCEQRSFNRFYFQGETVSVYSLLDPDTNEVVAYAMPVDVNKVVLERPDQEKYLKREDGRLRIGGLDYIISNDKALLKVEGLYVD